MKTHRLKAFTILKVTVTMMVAAILTAVTYTAYTIISQSSLSFHTKNNQMLTLELLDKLLERDFDRADRIQKNNNGILVTCSGQAIQYEFTPGGVLRTSATTDTFRVKIDSLNMLFAWQIINDDQNRLDELSFSIHYQNEEIPYHYYKVYSSVNLMQENSNASH